MPKNKNYYLWIAEAGLVLVAVVILSELILRTIVPLSSIVDPNGLYPKIWYLENYEKVRSRGKHPIHSSHPVLGWTHRPNIREPNFSTNSHGLRGKYEYSIRKPKGMTRAVVLGDSFTAGFGVGDQETYAAQLEKFLPNTEFLNLAVSGYGVDQAILRWELHGYRFEPDIAILGIFIPDFHRNVGTWWFDAPKPHFNIRDEKLVLASGALPPMEDIDQNIQRLRRELDSFLWLPRVWIATKYIFDKTVRKFQNNREPDGTFIQKQRVLELLIERLAEDCAKRRMELMILTIPTEYTPYPDEERILSLISNAALANNVDLLELDRFLDTNSVERARTPVFDAETGHWSAGGHRRAARQIADYLENHMFAK